MNATSSTLTRRQFVGASACAGAAAALAPAVAKASEASESYDVVVVGAGLSGLAAAVQACQSGLSAVVLESQKSAGGNGIGVEGTFGLGTELQAEAGIDIAPADIVHSELQDSQWRSNGSAWLDFIDNSSDNFSWMLENGVEFSGQVDDYGSGLFETMHWFDGPAGVAYVQPMVAKLQELGVPVQFETAATELVMDGDAVAGVRAEDADGNEVVYEAPAVILATGGFGSNPDLIALLGYDAEKVVSVSAPGHDGAGYTMAMAAGGESTIVEQGACLAHNLTLAFPHGTCFEPLLRLGFNPLPIWVNERSERFAPEDFALSNVEAMTLPVKNQQRAYAVFDENILGQFLEANDIERAAFDEALSSNEGGTLYQADTLAGLADAVDLDADALEATVEEYNGMCSAGTDTRLGKAAEYLQAIEQAPYYIARMDHVLFVTSIGGIKTDRSYHVVRKDGSAVDGLYAVGNDGNMLYRSIYTINMPGTCSGNCVNSGRIAAKDAAAYVAGKK